jgi:TetR/AcrR family transcriptional repressor of nem operon
MARPRSFDPDEILDIARDIFWRKGFQATSFDEITAASGITKPSLYAAFGDKKALFLKILDRYHEGILARTEGVLSQHSSARDAMRQWLSDFLQSSYIKGQRGCLSINAATDGALDQSELRTSIERYNRRLEGLLRARLRADRAEFKKNFDPDLTAYTILVVRSGLMALARQPPEPKKINAVIRHLMTLLA